MAKNAKQFEEREWGSFEVIGEFEIDNDIFSDLKGADVVIKKISVNPGEILSYQSHEKRRETWLIVQGRGIVIKDGLETWVSKGSQVRIKQGAKHRIKNTETELPLIFVEVCEGVFDEKDIIRYEDKYGRKDKKR
jgi:mannose-6-phosphate isomerase-like protein (cupin superfamily)